MCLLALALTVKPLANVEADYTCCDSQKEFGEKFQSVHLLPVASMEKGSIRIIAGIVRIFNLKFSGTQTTFAA